MRRHLLLYQALLRETSFGHHRRFIFPEFALGDKYQVYFLMIGRASGGHGFLFVELESPYGLITKNTGDFSVVINKGIQQVKDWER